MKKIFLALSILALPISISAASAAEKDTKQNSEAVQSARDRKIKDFTDKA